MRRIPTADGGAGSAYISGMRDTRSAVFEALERLVTQQSLFDTRASLTGLSHIAAQQRAPASVFLGLGVAGHHEISLGLPFDALGMLFAAEQARRILRAPTMTVLIADAHAVCNGHEAGLVAEMAQSHETVLRCVLRRLCWNHVHVVRARDLHALDAHVRLHEQIRRITPRDVHPYVTREIADIEFFARRSGSILKVGWALRAASSEVWDERAFDERYQRWVGGHVGFVYCKPGRTLDDRRRRAPPYLVRDPARRVCLARGERVREKLERASAHASVSTLRGVRRHLKAITRSYKQLVKPLSGNVEDQAQELLADLLGSEATA